MYENRAYVYKDGKHAGFLDERGKELSFTYAKSWNGSPIAPMFPLGTIANGDAVRAWFGNLLPEERRRKAFENLTKLSLDRITQFLSWFGEDLPGNISIVSGPGRKTRDITKIITDIVASDGNLDYASFKLSLSGGEPKTAVSIREDGILLAPTMDFPSTHIVKASQYYTFPEAFTLTAAKFLNVFPVVEFELREASGKPYLLIERYDRERMPDGSVRKLQQEDFCQALGVDMNAKYGAYGGIEHADMAKIMLERLTGKDIENFFGMTFFSMLVGNSDDHAKNFSMVERDGHWSLAPAYDMVSGSTVLNMALNGEMPEFLVNIDERQSRMFGTTYAPEEISENDIHIMSDLFKLPIPDMKCIFDAVKDGFSTVLENPPFMSIIDGVDLTPENRGFALKCMGRFVETGKRRVDKIGKAIESSFEKAACSQIPS